VPASLAGWPRAGQDFSPSQGTWFSCRLGLAGMLGLKSRTGTKGPSLSSLNWDVPLHSGLVAPELVMCAGCRITDEDTSLRISEIDKNSFLLAF